MKLYRVKEGCTVRWPNGEVRAESGEVFDLMVDIEPVQARQFMEALAMRDHCYRDAEPADGDPVERELPSYIQKSLIRRGWAPKAPAPAPAPKKRTRRAKPEAPDQD